MPEKWTDATEKKMLLEVIAISNPSVPHSAWARIATAMGGNYTGEACRQKYQGIKRSLKSSINGAPTPTSTPTKRKATKDAATHEDDDETSTLFSPQSKSTSPNKKMKKETASPNKKMKKEPTDDSSNLFSAAVFKAEKVGAGADAEGGIDLERDDLYADDENDAV